MNALGLTIRQDTVKVMQHYANLVIPTIKLQY